MEVELRHDASGVHDMLNRTTQCLEHHGGIREQFDSIAGDKVDRDFLHRDHEIEARAAVFQREILAEGCLVLSV